MDLSVKRVKTILTELSFISILYTQRNISLSNSLLCVNSKETIKKVKR
jgi:hypothetical protein